MDARVQGPFSTDSKGLRTVAVVTEAGLLRRTAERRTTYERPDILNPAGEGQAAAGDPDAGSPLQTASRGPSRRRSATGGSSLTNVGVFSRLILHLYWQHGSLAQLAEQRAFNPLVVGSSPTGPT